MSNPSEQNSNNGGWRLTREAIKAALTESDSSDSDDEQQEDEVNQDRITESGFLPSRLSIIEGYSEAMLQSVADITITTPVDQAPPGFPTQTSNLGTERGVELAALRYSKAQSNAERTKAGERLSFHREAALTKEDIALVNTVDSVLDTSTRVQQLRANIRTSWDSGVNETAQFEGTLDEKQLGSGFPKEEMREYAKSKFEDYKMLQSLPEETAEQKYEKKITLRAWADSFEEHWALRRLEE
ncbi:hypothetical protein L202_02574 [Cryptococcus amylolentus CBS 6039]|uniref:Uncharacterized protein n=2 Tax=Cryptococcus amylolentus TaxID=104669 RepID=A0A1E3I312_9TREE|nr:hypothetical protein L202_02574 [Cryptococcus amylolentus CBS 6039]ODN82296.1 hypothetical protein L202_02574 [Cryptococcus amylolentus CBS 6039]ODO09634.1 hypothetical protein I350_01846 [Cryptococcus amylolentus CBS 6273]